MLEQLLGIGCVALLAEDEGCGSKGGRVLGGHVSAGHVLADKVHGAGGDVVLGAAQVLVVDQVVGQLLGEVGTKEGGAG